MVTYRLMTILIEHTETLEYLAINGQWTKNAAEGKSFEATAVAFEAAKKEPIGKFTIVCYIPQTKQIINMDHGRGKGAADASSV